MNRIYIDGKIVSIPTFKMESGEIPHLTLCLCVRHKTRAGETRSETYRVSAWHKTALWAKEKLQRGQDGVFDCSSLVARAYAAQGKRWRYGGRLPRSNQEVYDDDFELLWPENYSDIG